MTRLLPGVALLLTTLFTLLLVFMRLQPYRDALDTEFEGCSAPCWGGIVPGVTTRDEALTHIEGDLISPLCFSRSGVACEMFQWSEPGAPQRTTGVQIQRGMVSSVSVKSPGLALGSVLLTLDGRDHLLYDVRVGYNFDRMVLWLTFSDASIGVSARTDCPTSYLTLMRAPVEMIVIQRPDARSPHDSIRLPTLRRTVYHLCER